MGKLLLLPLLGFILGISSACSPVPVSSASTLSDSGVQDSVSPSDINKDSSSFQSQSLSQSDQEIAEFKGQVFVASTKVVETLWESSGWSISRIPIDTTSQEVPDDCTLYPHAGVKDQWVGSCTGHILVPRTGAKHIAVMLIAPDGTTSMIQVAPPSDQP